VSDDDGAVDTSVQSVTVEEAVGGGIELSAEGGKRRGRHEIRLAWSGASSSRVDILRDGGLLVTTANDGSYTDSTENRGGRSYVYQVCEEGTSTCSAPVVVTY
jgi:hypothetical protein